MTAEKPTGPDSADEHLTTITETLYAVRQRLKDDHTLTTDQRMFARRLLFLALAPISEVRDILPTPTQDDTTQETQFDDSWDSYDDALTHIERQLCWLIHSLQAGQLAAHHYDQAPDEKCTTALAYVTALRDVLPDVTTNSPVLADWDTINPDTVDPHVGGRGDTDGRWLEYQLQRALGRWGYKTARRQHCFSLEVDVVAKRETKQHEPSDWIVAQCKDWTDTPITPTTLFRLCTVAFVCRAMPILCHTTDLTPRTETLARELEVRILDLTDLERAELPAPQIAKPTTEFDEWDQQYRARDNRGSLPLMFRREPGKRFSYVPGFTPVGRDADYEPTDSDTDDDTHPAAGH